MKRIIILLFLLTAIIPFAASSQENKELSDKLDTQGKAYDKQILELNTAIQKVISQSKIMTSNDIKSLPYQTEFRVGPDKNSPKYIEIVKHFYIKAELFSNNYIGLQEKTLRVYTDGNTISKIESILTTKNYKTLEYEKVTVVDPSPLTEGTDDIIFSHQYNKKKLIDDKKLADVKNTLSYPLRNELKIEFIIPNLNTLNNSLIFIVESKNKGFGDAEQNMSDFLRKTVQY